MAVSSLCVYCGSRLGADPAARRLAASLGARLAAEGVTLVYGGGRVGLMGTVADAALAAGGRVVGVIPHFLSRPELAHPGLSELIVVDSLHERKQRMFARADAFAALPGGIGTLDEAVEVATWKYLGLHDKPLVLVGDDRQWAPLVALLEHFVATGFADPQIAALFERAADVDALFAILGRAGERLPSAPPELL